MATTISPTRLSELLRRDTTAATGATYRTLAESLRMLIIDGRITVGSRLPSERALARSLGLSRTTITGAYAQLRDRGYAHARQGSGTVVQLSSAMDGGPAAVPLVGPLEPGDVQDGLIDLSAAVMPAPSGIASAFAEAIDELPWILAGSGYHPLGFEPLQQALAQRYCALGLPTVPAQIVVTNGALAATALIAATLLRPGERVVIETPNYPNTTAAIRGRGVRLVPVVVEPDGWDVKNVAHTVKRSDARLLALTPDFQNPTGALMPDEARGQLADLVGNVDVVVDETMVDFPARAGMSAKPFAVTAPQALLVGSSSKSHWGGLRIGWVRVPDERVRPGLLARIARTRLSLDLGAAPLEQAVLVRLLSNPDLVLHQQARVGEARTAAQQAIAHHLPSWHAPQPDGGLSLWCELPAPAVPSLGEAADVLGVRVGMGPLFGVDGGYHRFIRIACVLAPHLMSEGIRRLAQAVEAAPRTPDRRAVRRAVLA